jgi:hypothetical protein
VYSTQVLKSHIQFDSFHIRFSSTCDNNYSLSTTGGDNKCKRYERQIMCSFLCRGTFPCDSNTEAQFEQREISKKRKTFIENILKNFRFVGNRPRRVSEPPETLLDRFPTKRKFFSVKRLHTHERCN